MGVGWSWFTTRTAPRPHRWLALICHPSSRVDLQCVFIRSALRTFVLAGIPGLTTAWAVQVVRGLWAVAGAPPALPEGWTWVGAYSLTLFLVSDGSRYLLHRLSHRWSVLWRFHQVHHSAEVLTPLTLYRVHPVEQCIQALRGVVVLGSVGGLFAWLSFGQASPWTLYGVPALVLGLNALGANLRHSPVPLSYPRRWEHVLISPAQHQLHHGQRRDRQRANYGSFLALWDWMGGTLSCAQGEAPEKFGLQDEDRNHAPTSLASLLLGPLRGH